MSSIHTRPTTVAEVIEEQARAVFAVPTEVGVRRIYLDSIQGVSDALAIYKVEHPDPPNEACSPDSRRFAHEQGKLYSRLNGAQPIFALVGRDDLNTLYGRLLTLADASFADQVQRKAFKDMVRTVFWFNWVPNLDTDEPSHGAPIDS
jgi:hypothetical protein